MKSRKKKLNPWDYDNFIENKLKNNYEVYFSNKLILKDVIEKKKLNKEKQYLVVGGSNWKKNQ